MYSLSEDLKLGTVFALSSLVSHDCMDLFNFDTKLDWKLCSGIFAIMSATEKIFRGYKLGRTEI